MSLKIELEKSPPSPYLNLFEIKPGFELGSQAKTISPAAVVSFGPNLAEQLSERFEKIGLPFRPNRHGLTDFSPNLQIRIVRHNPLSRYNGRYIIHHHVAVIPADYPGAKTITLMVIPVAIRESDQNKTSPPQLQNEIRQALPNEPALSWGLAIDFYAGDKGAEAFIRKINAKQPNRPNDTVIISSPEDLAKEHQRLGQQIANRQRRISQIREAFSP